MNENQQENELMICTKSDLSEKINKKWTMCIINILGVEKGKRFNEIKKDSMGNINSRTLSMRLKELQKEGIITREVKPKAPPEVRYILTEDGWELYEALQPLFQYLDQHGNNGSNGQN
ncbi:helix-turn-helix domain-containing protein [Methanonatronarchaeum sp. AMET6-2]|uniref:winged helix-turn-helix transcriptional regulator n=1 Tax=Methanonatronarchaeum sp. AMET6-2 TaxID=2933293 RepID=UPI0012299027|nr:helix-turn-helix domain-containing protein [Methanonatronarchaeum sp. AMET6-2]RZN62862.1 MAG: transcriptional regulator [Methanonatronarchaeia archaeon]UOY09478.1 helix-turn-helix transcriptional regulator [Methanonatronarchaeum sp. AMET6-2]